MDFNDACMSVINELGLIENKRMAVLYYSNLGDFYSLCATIEKVEKQLDKEFFILYCSDRHKEIISWFEFGDYSIKSHRISEEIYFTISRASVKMKNKVLEHFIFWQCGDEEFRAHTRNTTDDFKKFLKKPQIPYVNIPEKYKEYIVPQKTVMIIPEAGAVEPFPVWFWNFSAYIFKILGYSVIFNVPPDRAKLYKGTALFVPISDVVHFANECGYVFGVRTGLLDVLSSTSAKMIIFSTSSYGPIDEVYNIDNSDMRIKTIFYNGTDPFFLNTEPIKYVNEDYKERTDAILRLMHRLYESESKMVGASYPAEMLDSYKATEMFNKFMVGRPWAKVQPFGDVAYSYDIANDKIVFAIRNLSVDKYRFDYKIFHNDICLENFEDMRSTCFLYPVEKSGEYYVRATITDLGNYYQEYFESQHLTYTAPIPNSLRCLSLCVDICSYIMALKVFGKDIVVIICSKDSHTFFSKNKSTEVLQLLRMLGLKSDLEGTPRYSYIGVVDSLDVVYENMSKDKTIEYQYEFEDCNIVAESSGYNVTHSPKKSIAIKVNGENKAVDSRGLNIVVLDRKSKAVIDSVAFDTFDGNNAKRKNVPLSVQLTEFNRSRLPLSTNEIYLLDQIKQTNNIKDMVGTLENVKGGFERQVAELKESQTKQANSINDVIGSLKSVKGGFENQVAELKKTLDESRELRARIDELTRKNAQLIEKSTRLEMEHRTLSTELEHSRSQILDLKSSIKKSTSEVNSLKGSNQELNDRIAGYENSRSWRITKPLRLIMTFFRKLLGKKNVK